MQNLAFVMLQTKNIKKKRKQDIYNFKNASVVKSCYNCRGICYLIAITNR